MGEGGYKIIGLLQARDSTLPRGLVCRTDRKDQPDNDIPHGLLLGD
jgi:hypothetical protein